MDPPLSFTFSLSLSICLPFTLEETTIFQIIFDDNIGDGIENKFNVVRISGTG